MRLKLVTDKGEQHSHKDFYPNMDIMRYVMALGVMVAHFNTLCGFNIPFIISSYDSVGGFFALSGFLMYPSFCKAKTIKVYVLHRAIRIMPPYIFTVLLFALGLSAISTYSPQEYFASSDFWKYLAANLSFANWLHPDLPGVFHGAEYLMPAVNGSLWTMKVEWCLYLSVPICFWLVRKLKTRKEIMAIAMIVLSLIYRLIFLYLFVTTEKGIYEILGRQFFGQLSYFYCGMLIYFYKDFFKKHCYTLIAVTLPLAFVYKFIPLGNIILAPMVISILILSISMLKYTIPWLWHKNNLSYNLYLLHFPVFQLAVYFGIKEMSAWPAFFLTAIATISIAYIGNLLVDRPVFKLKKYIK